jgi:hypothetical protein
MVRRLCPAKLLEKHEPPKATSQSPSSDAPVMTLAGGPETIDESLEPVPILMPRAAGRMDSGFSTAVDTELVACVITRRDRGWLIWG